MLKKSKKVERNSELRVMPSKSLKNSSRRMNETVTALASRLRVFFLLLMIMDSFETPLSRLCRKIFVELRLGSCTLGRI